ncbi:MAG: hypothetical protein ABS944_17675 [Solibacillus sp.]|uniref:hypothetical protein n=1 Tax=Solibacillus sp. TaxID=1909654 RepID=UPI003314E3F3
MQSGSLPQSEWEGEEEMNLDKLSIDIESTKLARKLRAVAKHAEQLANELEAIDNEWQCNCGCTKYVDESLIDDETVICAKRICDDCGEAYVINNDLPTHLEGSE